MPMYFFVVSRLPYQEGRRCRPIHIDRPFRAKHYRPVRAPSTSCYYDICAPGLLWYLLCYAPVDSLVWWKKPVLAPGRRVGIDNLFVVRFFREEHVLLLMYVCCGCDFIRL